MPSSIRNACTNGKVATIWWQSVQRQLRRCSLRWSLDERDAQQRRVANAIPRRCERYIQMLRTLYPDAANAISRCCERYTEMLRTRCDFFKQRTLCANIYSLLW